MKQDLRKAYIAAAVYTVIIGLSFIFVKMALRSAGPLDLLAHRFTFSAAAASVPLLFGWLKLKIDWRKDFWPILGLALFYPVLYFALQVFGLVYTTSSQAGIIQATVPILTIVLSSLILKEYSSRWQILAAVASVSGVIFIFVMSKVADGNNTLIGNLLILLSALSVAAYSVFARRMGQKHDIFTLTYVMTLMGFVIFNTVALGAHISNGSLGQFIAPLKDSRFLLCMLYLGILSSLLTSYLSNFALARIEAPKMSIFTNLATLITVLAGLVVLKEQLEWFHIAGGAVVIAGALGYNMLPSVNKAAKG